MILDVLLPAGLILIMLGMGLSLTADDFARVVQRPPPVLAGLASILLVTPAIGFVIAAAFSLPPALAVGVIMIAACPGGTFSNLLTHYARGDLALSVSMTAVASLVAVLTMPLMVTLALDLFWTKDVGVHLPFLDTVRRIFMLTVLPVAAGMMVRRFAPRVAHRTADPAKNLAAILIVVIFAYLIVIQADILKEALVTLAVPVISLNLLSVAVGMTAAVLVRAAPRERVAVTMEHAIKQEGMGIFIAGSLIGNVQMTLPLMVNSWIGVLVGVILVTVFRRRRTDSICDSNRD